MIEAERLSPERVMHYWPHIVREMDLVPHIWDKWWTKDYLYDAVMQGRMQLWAVGDQDRVRLIVFTQILYYPANVMLQVFLALGNGLRDCLPTLFATLEKFAADNGCTLGHVVGREGWKVELAPYGFEQVTVNLFREVPTIRMQ